MPVATEFVVIQSSEAFRQDRSIVHPLLEFAKEAGAIGIYYGFTEENVREAYLVIVWEDIEDHYALMNDQAAYPKLKAIEEKCISAPNAMFHVHFEPDRSLATALNAPLTTLTQGLALKTGAKKETLLDVLLRTTSAKAASVCSGKLVERDEYAALYGWSSIEDGAAIRKADTELEQSIKQAAYHTENKKIGTIRLTAYLRYEA